MTDTKQEALVPQVESAALPAPVAKRGITEAQWRTLCNSLFPGAASNSVLMVWDYCAARGLDPMKKPCHIVPMEVKDVKTNTYAWRDVVMPGIYEYRTTAHRTGEYLGHSEPEYGPESEAFGVKAPEWCKMTMYRWNNLAKMKVPFPVQVFFPEVCATRKDKDTKQIVANSRWTRAPKQMLCKCTEAAGIREAFPEEIGGEPTAEEMDGQQHGTIIDVTPQPPSAFERLPEALRDIVEQALAALKLTAGSRLAKINEYIGADGIDPEDGAHKLLDWVKAELTTGQPRKKKDDGNAKAVKSEPNGMGVKVAPSQPASPVLDPVGPVAVAPTVEKAPVPAVEAEEALF